MTENKADQFDIKKPIKKLFLLSLILITINVIFFPLVVKQRMSFIEILVLFLFSVNILGFLIGFIVALFPYRGLTYKKKYLRASVFSIVGLNFLNAFGLFLIFIMTMFGWYGKDETNVTHIPNSDTIVVYDEIGNVRAKGRMLNKIKEGNWKEWDENGAIVTDMYYVNGLAEGNAISYYPNGQKELAGNYTKQKADGFFTIWYASGMKKAEGNFKLDKKVGIWKTWLEDGSSGTDINYDVEEK